MAWLIYQLNSSTSALDKVQQAMKRSNDSLLKAAEQSYQANKQLNFLLIELDAMSKSDIIPVAMEAVDARKRFLDYSNRLSSVE